MSIPFRDPIETALAQLIERARAIEGGEVASYIPQLAKANPDHLGVALASVRGVVHEAGDTDVEFTIQSASKPFVYALALERMGLERVSQHIGLEPSGEPFNAISLDAVSGRPFNAMINAGAIVTSSLANGDTALEKFDTIHAGLSAFAGRGLDMDEAVFESERETGNRNRALAYLAQSTGALASDASVATEAYFRQCSLLVNARDIAVMGATLAAGGINPFTRERVVSADVARWTTGVMSSCGMYDESGEWMVKVGLPAKSGVGGGVIGLLPGQFGIGTFSPPLDAKGNSARGVAMMQLLSEKYELHTLAHRDVPLSPIASLTVEDNSTVVVLRGDLVFQGTEEVISRIAPLSREFGALTLDFTHVTRVGPGAKLILLAALKEAKTRGTTLIFRDPEGLLD